MQPYQWQVSPPQQQSQQPNFINQPRMQPNYPNLNSPTHLNQNQPPPFYPQPNFMQPIKSRPDEIDKTKSIMHKSGIMPSTSTTQTNKNSFGGLGKLESMGRFIKEEPDLHQKTLDIPQKINNQSNNFEVKVEHDQMSASMIVPKANDEINRFPSFNIQQNQAFKNFTPLTFNSNKKTQSSMISASNQSLESNPIETPEEKRKREIEEIKKQLNSLNKRMEGSGLNKKFQKLPENATNNTLNNTNEPQTNNNQQYIQLSTRKRVGAQSMMINSPETETNNFFNKYSGANYQQTTNEIQNNYSNNAQNYQQNNFQSYQPFQPQPNYQPQSNYQHQNNQQTSNFQNNQHSGQIQPNQYVIPPPQSKNLMNFKESVELQSPKLINPSKNNVNVVQAQQQPSQNLSVNNASLGNNNFNSTQAVYSVPKSPVQNQDSEGGMFKKKKQNPYIGQQKLEDKSPKTLLASPKNSQNLNQNIPVFKAQEKTSPILPVTTSINPPSSGFSKNSFKFTQEVEIESKFSKNMQQPIKKQFKRSDFKIGKKMGKGQFGEVMLVQHKETGFICGLKVMSKKQIREQKYQNQIARELSIQFYLNHRNVAPLYGYFEDEENVYLLVEFCTGGQLLEMLRKNNRMDEALVSPIIREIAEGIDYIHKETIIHRDIKPENILFNFGVVKISDFGWAVYNGSGLRRTVSGSPLYYSPEVVLETQYDQKIDIWAIGMMTYECILGKIPFRIYSELDLNRIVQDEIKFPEYIDTTDESRDFILKIMKKKPEERMQIKQMMRHPFITKYNQQKVAPEIIEDIKKVLI